MLVAAAAREEANWLRNDESVADDWVAGDMVARVGDWLADDILGVAGGGGVA